MGKRLIQQRRGRGTSTYRANGHHVKGEFSRPSLPTMGTVVDVIHCPAHTVPVMEVSYATGEQLLSPAPQGIKVGDAIAVSVVGEVRLGSIMSLRDIPEGTAIHNIELKPGDGGKLVRSSGVAARIISKTETGVRVKLPSRKEKMFPFECRASIGILGGGGRPEKPFLKAGARWHKMKARNKHYPRVCGISMNAVDHPFGGKCSHIKGRPTLSPRNAPPGRKVGKIAPRRTGRRKE